MSHGSSILAINGGSSSVRFAVYTSGEPPERLTSGKVERVGAGVVADLEAQVDMAAVSAVGHRIVHGMTRTAPAALTPEVIAELRGNIPFAPEHLPREIELIEALGSRHPNLRQIACFDTAFHLTMPQVARTFAIPRRFQEQGVVRYGFHGLSYAYLVEELARITGTAQGRAVIAHLGNGASLCAVRDGQSVDTTMGFTPAGGIPMGTRSGDLDPGVAWYLQTAGRMDAEEFIRVINHESGLLGVSGSSSDMRDLLAKEETDPAAAEAVELFCYQVRKGVGALAAALEGLDTVVFSGGIGENSPVVRARICEGLRFLGIEIHEATNRSGGQRISCEDSRVGVYCIPTNEELMIARLVYRHTRAGG